MRIEVIVTEDGIMLPATSGLYDLVPDEQVGARLRGMNGATEKPKKARKQRKTRNALGKGIAEGTAQ